MVGKLREKIYEPHPVLESRCWGWESGRNCCVNYKGSSGNAVCPGGSQGDPVWIPFRITRGLRRIGRSKSAWGLVWVVISHLSEGGKGQRTERRHGGPQNHLRFHKCLPNQRREKEPFGRSRRSHLSASALTRCPLHRVPLRCFINVGRFLLWLQMCR